MRGRDRRRVPLAVSQSARHALAAALSLSLAPAASSQPLRGGPQLASVFIHGPVRMAGVRARLDAARASLAACPRAGVAEGAEATVAMRVGDDGRVQAARVDGGPALPRATLACLVARHRTLTFPTARGVGPLTIDARWVYPGRPAGAPLPAPPRPPPPARPTLTGSVAVTALTADAAGSVETLREEMLRRSNELRDCYEARLDQRPPFEGTLTLALTFAPGEPIHRPASVIRRGGSLADAAVVMCVTTLVRRSVFGVEPATTRATVSLAFTIARGGRE